MAKTLSSAKKRLWRLVSEYVRRKDAVNGYVQCYTCGKVKHWKEVDAGHAIPGRKNKVLFDLEIIRPQCKECNGPKAGMQYEFGKRLNEENGAGWFEQKQIDAKGTKKYSLWEIEEMIEEFKQKIKELD